MTGSGTDRPKRKLLTQCGLRPAGLIVLLACAAVVLASPSAFSQSQPVQPPVQPPVQTPPAQTAPPTPPAQTPPSGSGTGSPQLPTGEQSTDPYLQYAQNVSVRISQLETSAFPTVRAFVSVTDENGVLLRTLKEGNFALTENNIAAADLHFGNRDELNLPLAIQFVVDISGSMGVQLDDQGTTPVTMEVEAIRQFVSQLKPGDRAGLIVFSDAAMRMVPMTDDHPSLLRELDNLVGFGQTALYDGLMLGMEELLIDTQPARRALIVLSDGLDNRSLETPQTILQFYDDNILKANLGFSVYALGLGEEIDRIGLNEIARRTGGMYFDSPTAQDLAAVYDNILQQIQSEYLLEYTSPGESKPGQIIDVQVTLNGTGTFTPGKYTYRSPGLSKALARAFWPGLITVAILLAVLIIATIYKISRRVWLTVMITPLEGKDLPVSSRGGDIGTLESCEVRIDSDPAMLPLHASLRETANGYVLEAVDPASPIILGNRLLAKKLLRSGDRFTLGYTTFIFNERVARPGDGDEILAEHVYSAPQPQITEAIQTGAQAAAAPSGPRKAPSTMVGQSGPHAGQRYTLAQGENVIGRLEGTIQLNDSQVSRRHCQLTLASGMATLLDPGSTNGTRVNGVRCQPGITQAVYAGDVLGIGAGEFRLE